MQPANLHIESVLDEEVESSLIVADFSRGRQVENQNQRCNLRVMQAMKMNILWMIWTTGKQSLSENCQSVWGVSLKFCLFYCHSYLSYRCGLLQENELRNLITIPSLNPNTITAQQVGIILPTQSSKPRTPGELPRSQQTLPIKRQNSKQRMTPQQAALAMTNDMIVANVAAAVGSPHRDKTSMQLALQQLQQQHGTTDVGTLQKKILSAQLAQQQRLKEEPDGPQKENGNRQLTIQMPPNLVQGKSQVPLSPSSNSLSQLGSGMSPVNTESLDSQLRQQIQKKQTTLPNTPVDSPPQHHSLPTLTNHV
jgi:hypothetical protein